ncbi:MAG TPA: ABC transporter permease, partial [Candidatus Baltobacteraceae bacterium]|nr:ABC transporter permease [Candidatus Baltobacteraceae bacterium]
MFYVVAVQGKFARMLHVEKQWLRNAPLPKSFSNYFGRKLFLFGLTVHGLGAFALISIGVIMRKWNVAKNTIRPLIFRETARAGIKLLPMFAFVALALGFLTIGQVMSGLTHIGASGAIQYLGTIMVIVIVRELGPLLAAVLVLARVGTANVIELGNARALGDVEALEAMGVDPVHYLVAPRVIGMTIGVFALTVFLILGTLVAGYLFAFLQEVPLTPSQYYSQLADSLTTLDFAVVAFKSLLFGFFIAIVTCYHGLAQPLRLEE